MSAKYICDGCGKEEKAISSRGDRNWTKPYSWFNRSDKEGIQDACSRECIETVSKKTGKTNMVMPI